MAAVTTGREVATGTLWISKSDSEKVRIRVAARCGTPDCTYNGQLNIYEESSFASGCSVVGNISEPSRVISLSHINEVSSLNTSHPTFMTGLTKEPGVSKEGSENGMSMFQDDILYPTHEPLWGFMLLLQTGEAVELFADTREQQQLWIKYLHLMSMFPSSPIPEEPRVNPIRDSFRSRVKLSNFDADSVWPVYILSEEVGSRIQALGVHVVTLQSTLSTNKPARMTIISPLDNEPIVTWEANKMRRTGSLGNLVFIEIGRRCEGGPGLIWMYAAPEDSLSFRETITRFLFNGDARPVNNSGMSGTTPAYQYDSVSNSSVATVTITTPTSISSSPSSSGGSSFRLSFSSPIEAPTKSKAEYDSAEIEEEVDQATYDYAFTGPNGPFFNSSGSNKRSNTLSSSSLSTSPPPVNLYTHPSRHKAHRRTFSGGMGSKRELLSELSTGSLYNGHKHGGSNDSGVGTATTGSQATLEQDFLEIDKSLNELMSDLSTSPKHYSSQPLQDEDNNLDSIIASLEEFAKDGEDTFSTTTTDMPSSRPPFKRSNTLPNNANSSQNHRRTNSTSSCHPVHYLETRRKKAELQGASEYITMKATSPLIKQKPSLLSNRLSHDAVELSPIKEATPTPTNSLTTPTSSLQETTPTKSLTTPTNSLRGSGEGEYQNYPQPEDIAKGTPIMYTTPYENLETEGQVHTSGTINDDDIYENNEPLKEDNKINGFNSLFSSTFSELDNLQNILEQLGN